MYWFSLFKDGRSQTFLGIYIHYHGWNILLFFKLHRMLPIYKNKKKYKNTKLAYRLMICCFHCLIEDRKGKVKRKEISPIHIGKRRSRNVSLWHIYPWKDWLIWYQRNSSIIASVFILSMTFKKIQSTRNVQYAKQQEQFLFLLTFT